MKNFYYTFLPNIKTFYDFNYGVIMTRFDQTYKNIDYAWFRFMWIEDYNSLKDISLKRKYLFTLAVIWWFFQLFVLNVIKIILTGFTFSLYLVFLARRLVRFIKNKILKKLFLFFFHKIKTYIFYRIGLNGCNYFYTHPTFYFCKKFTFFYMHCNSLKHYVLTYFFLRGLVILTYINYINFVYIKKIIDSILFIDWKHLYKKPYCYTEKAPDIDVYCGIFFSILSIFIRKTGFIIFLLFIYFIFILDIGNFSFIFEMNSPMTLLLSLNFLAFDYANIYMIYYYITGYLIMIIFYNIRSIFDIVFFNIRLMFFFYVSKIFIYYFFYGIYYIYMLCFFLIFFHLYLIILHNNLSEFLYYKLRQFI